ncbi:MAG: pseudaminic acid cytidylyltransferase, partial [Bacteroidaceae bacterium]
YPTAPFINPEKIKRGMNLLFESEADSVLPVVRFSYPPQRCLVLRDERIQMLCPENYNIRSQDFEPYYHDAGQFYCLKSEALINECKLYCRTSVPIELLEREVQDIDNEEDWEIAEMKYKILKKLL